MLNGPCFADMHVHSHYSDSSVPVFELIQEAKDCSIEVLALTDHDTIQGLSPACAYAEEIKIHVIPGIEISAWDHVVDKKVHILGYFVSPQDADIEEFCKQVRFQRSQATEKLYKHFSDQGFPCRWERVLELTQPGDSPFRLHLVRAILEELPADASSETIRIQLEHDSEDLQNSIRYPDAREAVSLLRDRGALPVLAHPAHYDNFDIIPRLADAGLLGIEAYHPCHNPVETAYCKRLAERYNLVVSGGSDFHGEYDPSGATLGCRGIDREDYNKLTAKRRIHIVRS